MTPRKNFDPNADRPYDDENSLTKMARLSWDVGGMLTRFDQIDEKLGKIDAKFEVFSGSFVTQREFAIVRNIVFGMVGLILVGFMGAVITFFLRQGGS
jgi:hypothetical protein